MLPSRIRRILLEAAAQDYEMTRRILARLPGVPVEVIPDRGVLRPGEEGRHSWLRQAKETLLLAVQRGPFLRPCPGTRDYLCCGYQVLQVGMNCPFDCTYCILQGYVNQPAVTLFANVEHLLEELEAACAHEPARCWRLGTGEFGDSLALDDLMGLNKQLIPAIAAQPRACLEIKSKWHRQDHLLSLGPNPRVVFAWSVNPPEIIAEAERGAASLQARLRAASQAVAAGFRVAFHFDPLIHFSGWEAGYRTTVEALGRTVPPDAVAWISLGGLRFLPSLRRIILQRFPATRLAAGEMVRAPDGKLRYFKTLRVEMYSRLRDWLGEALPGVLVYLCMESPRVWQEVFGWKPEEGDLAKLLDRQIFPPGDFPGEGG